MNNSVVQCWTHPSLIAEMEYFHRCAFFLLQISKAHVVSSVLGQVHWCTVCVPIGFPETQNSQKQIRTSHPLWILCYGVTPHASCHTWPTVHMFRNNPLFFDTVKECATVRFTNYLVSYWVLSYILSFLCQRLGTNSTVFIQSSLFSKNFHLGVCPEVFGFRDKSSYEDSQSSLSSAFIYTVLYTT